MESRDSLIARLEALGFTDYDETYIIDYLPNREFISKVVDRMERDRTTITYGGRTWGFWPGFIIGTFCGLVVFGIGIAGEGIWDQGIATGRLLCESDFARERLYGGSNE